MELFLLKPFRFVEVENLPYRNDGKGGNVFHGVGSHVMNSDLNDRTHRIAFEVATKGQANDCHLLRHNLRLEVDGQPIDSANHEQKWEQESRHQTQNPSISAYQWDQYVQFSVDEPSIVSIYIDMLFSDSPEW